MPLSTRRAGIDRSVVEEVAESVVKAMRVLCRLYRRRHRSGVQQQSLEYSQYRGHDLPRHPAAHEEGQHEADPAKIVIHRGKTAGDHVAEKMAAIERRKRHQVE